MLELIKGFLYEIGTFMWGLDVLTLDHELKSVSGQCTVNCIQTADECIYLLLLRPPMNAYKLDILLGFDS